MNVKNMAHNYRTPQRKIALGDIKNAPSAIEKSSLRMVDVKTTTTMTDESVEKESASSKYVDYFNVWTDSLALSDAEVNRWITMLNVARTTNLDNEERTPPSSPPSFFEEEEIPCKIFVFACSNCWHFVDKFPILILVPDDTFEMLEAPPLPEFSSEPGSPASDSSMYYSFDDNSFELDL